MENSVKPEINYIESKPPRDKYVYLSSLILTVFGAIVLVFGLITFFAADRLDLQIIDRTTFLLLILLNPDFYFGIFGLLSARKPKRAMIIIIMAVISLVVYGYGVLSSGRIEFANVVGFLIRLFFLYGGIHMKMNQPREEVF